jgi:hypothetical protein
VIGRVLGIAVRDEPSALAYWHGEYVALDRDEQGQRWADVSLPPRPRDLTV